MKLLDYPMGLSVTESQIEAGESDSSPKVEFRHPEQVSNTLFQAEYHFLYTI